jgi:hypothetical protein
MQFVAYFVLFQNLFNYFLLQFNTVRWQGFFASQLNPSIKELLASLCEQSP